MLKARARAPRIHRSLFFRHPPLTVLLVPTLSLSLLIPYPATPVFVPLVYPLVSLSPSRARTCRPLSFHPGSHNPFRPSLSSSSYIALVPTRGDICRADSFSSRKLRHLRSLVLELRADDAIPKEGFEQVRLPTNSLSSSGSSSRHHPAFET